MSDVLLSTVLEARMFDGVRVQLEVDKARAKEETQKGKKVIVPTFVLKCLKVTEWYALGRLSVGKIFNEDQKEEEGYSKIKEDFNKLGFSLVDVENMNVDGKPLEIEHETIGTDLGKYKRVPLSWIEKYLHLEQVQELLHIINRINSPSKEDRESVNFTFK